MVGRTSAAITCASTARRRIVVPRRWSRMSAVQPNAGARLNRILARRPVGLLRVVVGMPRRWWRQRIVFRIAIRVGRGLRHRCRVVHGELAQCVTAVARRARLVFVIGNRARVCSGNLVAACELPAIFASLRVSRRSPRRTGMRDAHCDRRDRGDRRNWRQRRSAGVSTSRRMPGSSTSSRFTGALAKSVRAPVSPSSAASAS